MGEVDRAFIQKLAWNLLNRPDALRAQIVKAECFPKSSVPEAGGKSNAQGITRVLDSLRLNVFYLPCNDSSIRIWEDPWIPTLEWYHPEWNPAVSPNSLVSRVVDPVDKATGGWNMISCLLLPLLVRC
ncbi:hypothetical protein CJ030_MR4G004740 [Morella rubra]|uniref:Uncharacterized protein n=1 Tax=Morella rubra TaxID=262757 RepID=A0A6A1VRV9_9ROSI|nr:hypothetical protein CJ030_MR4G004740 [Morella rubra]